MRQDASQSNLLLQNCRVVLPSQILQPGSVLIEGQRIARIASRIETPTETATLDLNGSTLLPGFIDVHIHGAVDLDTTNAKASQLAEIAAFLTTNGVTGWMPTVVPAAQQTYEGVVREVDELMSTQSYKTARVLGLHYEGPFVSEAHCGALQVAHFRTFSSESQLQSLPVLRSEGAVMMMTVAPEINGGIDLVKAYTGKGWIISIGHTNATPEILDKALAAGARHMTHFMNAMAPLHHRKPGPIGWGLSRADVTCDVIADGIHVDPFVLRLLLKIKGARGLTLISDAIAAAGRGDGEYQIWGETISVKDGRTSNSSGTIAGSVITMLDAVRLMRSLAASDLEIAWMASSNPAHLLRLEKECGSIEEGKRADLVALDESGNVKLTIVGGKIAFQSE